MAKKYVYTFTITIYPGGESFVEYPISAKEKKLIIEAMDNLDAFSDVEELSDLYERVLKAAREKLLEDLDLTGDTDIDVDELDYDVDFGDEIEE